MYNLKKQFEILSLKKRKQLKQLKRLIFLIQFQVRKLVYGDRYPILDLKSQFLFKIII
jgi:hypothetical protein